MREHEQECFARALQVTLEDIQPFDLISEIPSDAVLAQTDAVLVGGSGDYSVVEGGVWLPACMEFFFKLYEENKPTFASCWGFQALARALGGKVVTDLNRAEVGTHQFEMTDDGMNDPVFGPLGQEFLAQIGHQDIVDVLPADAVLLCSTKRVANQAYTFRDKTIYATQFHPELEVDGLLMRLQAYPEYVERITGMPMEEFVTTCKPAPETINVLSRFKELV